MAVRGQTWTGEHGEDISIVLTGASDAPNPSGWALAAYFFVKGNAAALTVTPTAGGTAGAYTISIPLTRAQTLSTLTKRSYAVEVWRTDAGSGRLLAEGVLWLEDTGRPGS